MKKKDFYYHLSKKNNLRSRAYFKIKKIDEKFNIFKNDISILDLGAFPGGWSLYLSKKYNCSVTAVDILELKPIPNVLFIKKDIFSKDLFEVLKKYDVIISDVSMNVFGINSIDFFNSKKILKKIFEINDIFLKKGGNTVIKFFFNSSDLEIQSILKNVKMKFKKSYMFKSTASRTESYELYFIGVYKLW